MIIEAHRYPGLDKDDTESKRVIEWVNANGGKIVGLADNRGGIGISTLEGEMEIKPGDWIIKGVKGEFYPCKPDIFEATYEEVEYSDE